MSKLRLSGLAGGLVIALVVAVVLAGPISNALFGSDDGKSGSTSVVLANEATPPPATSPPATPPPATPAITVEATPDPTPPAAVTDVAALQEAGVNELGVIPVIMYHAFVTNPDPEDPWTRGLDDFRGDLQWLYDNNFYLLSIRDLLDGNIDVPFGKHPVVLTYDDASARQFQFMQNEQGELVPTPDSAMGVLEAFFAAHPDFGKSSHFGVVGNNCFGWHEDFVEFNSGDEYCRMKLQWLSDNGYEVGNHTWTHENLNLISDDAVHEQVGRNIAFLDERMQGPGNQSLILTLPFGEQPPTGSDGSRAILETGVNWEGQTYQVEALLLVSGGPMFSPYSSWFDPMKITRFNSDETSLAIWFGNFERGDVLLYTSDGNPDTVTIPDPLPAFLQNEFDPAYIEGMGKTLVRYDSGIVPEEPLTALPALNPGVEVYTSDSGVRLRRDASTTGEVIKELNARTALTIVEGPVTADGHTWWRVRLEDGTEGWLVEDFLAGPPAG